MNVYYDHLKNTNCTTVQFSLIILKKKQLPKFNNNFNDKYQEIFSFSDFIIL